METQKTVGQTVSDHKTELISIYRENSTEILQILRGQGIGYKFIGEDQSNRMLFQITYYENQANNVRLVRKGIKQLERGNQITDLILIGIKRLLA